MDGGNFLMVCGVADCVCWPCNFIKSLYHDMKNSFIIHKNKIQMGNNDLVLEDPTTMWVMVVNYFTMLCSFCTFGIGTVYYFENVHLTVANRVNPKCTKRTQHCKIINHHNPQTDEVLDLVFILRAISECGTVLWDLKIYSLSKWVVILVSWDVKFEVLTVKHIFTFPFYFFLWDQSIMMRAVIPISYSIFVMTMVSFFGASFDNYDLVHSFQGSFITPMLLEIFKDPILRVLTDKVTLPQEILQVEKWLVVAYAISIIFGYYVRYAPILNLIQAPAPAPASAQAAQAQAQAQIELQIHGGQAPAQIELQIHGGEP